MVGKIPIVTLHFLIAILSLADVSDMVPRDFIVVLIFYGIMDNKNMIYIRTISRFENALLSEPIPFLD